MRLLGTLLLRSRVQLALTTFAGAVSGLSTTLLIVLVNRMIHLHGICSPRLICLFIFFCALRLITGLISHAMLVRLSQNAVYDLRLRICRGVIGAPLRQLEQLGAARLSSIFADDMLHIATAAINLPYLFVNAVILLGCFVYLGWLSLTVLVWMAPCIAAGAVSYALATRRANARLRLGRDEQGRLAYLFLGLFHGVKELKINTRRQDEYFTKSLGQAADRVRRHHIAGITIYSAAANCSRLLFFVYVGFIILRPHDAVAESNGIDASHLAAYVIVILYMMAPLEAILNAWPYLAQAEVALAKVEMLSFDLQPEIRSCDGVHAVAPSSWRKLQLLDVCYRYHDAADATRFELGPLSLVIEPGQTTLLVGGNGSGKTTLGKLITGLYEADSGAILLDGVAVNSAHRALFTAVFSDFYLFERLQGIDPERLALCGDYLRKLKLDHKVKYGQQAFSTTELSHGQRKRLALLVALLEDRPIYLFDEWAADQDPEFKHIFYRQIIPELKSRGKAIVMITHDDRYFDIADYLYQLDDGKLSLIESVDLLAECVNR